MFDQRDHRVHRGEVGVVLGHAESGVVWGRPRSTHTGTVRQRGGHQRGHLPPCDDAEVALEDRRGDIEVSLCHEWFLM